MYSNANQLTLSPQMFSWRTRRRRRRRVLGDVECSSHHGSFSLEHACIPPSYAPLVVVSSAGDWARSSTVRISN
jgi:hypothetical protein